MLTVTIRSPLGPPLPPAPACPFARTFAPSVTPAGMETSTLLSFPFSRNSTVRLVPVRASSRVISAGTVASLPLVGGLAGAAPGEPVPNMVWKKLEKGCPLLPPKNCSRSSGEILRYSTLVSPFPNGDPGPNGDPPGAPARSHCCHCGPSWSYFFLFSGSPSTS